MPAAPFEYPISLVGECRVRVKGNNRAAGRTGSIPSPSMGALHN